MALTRVQKSTIAKTAATGLTALTVTWGANPAIGNAIVVGVGGKTTNNLVTSCTDNYGNTYTAGFAPAGHSSSGVAVAFWYCANVTATGAGFAITATGANVHRMTVAVEVGNVGLGLTVGRTINTNASGGPGLTGTTATLTTADSIVFAAIDVASNIAALTAAAGTPAWTEEAEVLSAGNPSAEIISRIVSATTAQSASWTWAGAANYAAALVTFHSLGPATATVPNVVGLTQAAATTAITAVGLTLGTVTTASSTTVAAGLVISQSPAASTSVAAGSAVAIVVSTGPPTVTVPNVVGLTEAAATTALTGAGLVKGTVTVGASTTVAAGLVSTQVPTAGGTAVVGSAVDLVISTGPPPWDLTVAGVSQKAKVLQRSVSIRLESGERSSARFSVTRVGGYLPARFETVQITDKAGAVLFAGPILSRVVEAVVPNHHTVAVEASDWWAYLDWGLVTLTFSAPVTTKAILLALVAALPAGYGFTVSSSQADGLTYDAYASGAEAKASDVVRGLAKDLKWRAAVSPTKVIRIAPSGSVAAPWTLTTANPHCRSARWHDPTGTPANRIVLRCGPAGVGAPVTVTWIGDGTTRVFSLDGQYVPSSSTRVNICFVGGTQLPVWPPGEGPADQIQWDYTLNSGTLTFIGTSPWHPPGVGVPVVITYYPQFPFTVVAASGATPVISEIYSDESITVYDQGVARAQALLAERNQPAARELEVLSRDDGWRPDQGITVALDAIDFTGTGTVGPVTITLTTVDEWLYTFTAVETTTVPATGLDLWRKLFQGSSGGAAGTPVGGAGGGGLAQLTGDVTAGPATGVAVATIANDAVTYAKVQNVSGASKLLGRGSAAGAGDVEELTLGTGLSITGTTINGPRNSALVNYSYNTGAEPPNAGQIRTDFGFPWGSTTKLWVRFVSVDDEDVYWGIMILSIGSAILLQDKDDHTKYARFVTTGAPIDKGLYAEIPVAWVANGSSIISGQQVLLQATAVSAVVQRRQVLVVLDGGGSVIAAGTRTYVSLPVGGTWKKWRIVSVDNAATAGSIVIDVWRDTYANYPPTVADTITASAKPTMSAASKAESATLTGWTTAFAAGDVLGFNVDSATTVTKVELVLEFE